MQNYRRRMPIRPAPVSLAILALLLAGWGCTFLTPTPVAWSLTATPGITPAQESASLSAFPTPLPTTVPNAAETPLPPSPAFTEPPPTPAGQNPTEPASPVTPAPAGPWLVYSRDSGRTIAAARLDGSSPAAVPLPEPLLWPEDLRSGAAPAGDWLAVRTGKPDLSSLNLTLVHLPDGKARVLTPLLSPDLFKQVQAAKPDLLPEAARAVTQPGALAWSPNGRYLAFVSAAEGASSDLYLYDVQTERSRRVTGGLNQVASPVWSPDGLWVIIQEVVNFTVDPGWKLGPVWAVATDHNEIRKLFDPPANSTRERVIGWIGQDTAVIMTQAPDSARDIREVPLSARRIGQLYGGPMEEAAFDPNSKSIAIRETALTGKALGLAPGLYQIIRSQGVPQYVQAGDWDRLEWSPSASRFFASGPQGFLLFSPGAENVLLKGEAWGSTSPSGLWLICWGDAGAGSRSGLRLYQPGGELLQEVTGDPVQQAAWQPDSKAFYFLSGGKLYRTAFPDARPALVDQDVQPGSLAWAGLPAR